MSVLPDRWEPALLTPYQVLEREGDVEAGVRVPWWNYDAV